MRLFTVRGMHQQQTLMRKISMMTKNFLKIQKCLLRFQNISWRSQNIYHGLKLFFSKVSKIFFKISKYFSWQKIIFQSLKIFFNILAASSMRPLSQYLQWGTRFHVFPKIDRDKTFFSCSMFLFHLCNCFHKDKEFHPIG